MAKEAIAKLNSFHEEFARWVCANPEKTLREAKEEFGYSVPWLSRIANSEAFRARLQELNSAADAMVIADIPTRLRGIAEQGLEKIEEALESTITKGPGSRIDRDYVSDTTEMALKALGYIGTKGPQQGPSGPEVSITADQVVIMQARERILNKSRSMERNEKEVKTINALPAPARSA